MSNTTRAAKRDVARQTMDEREVREALAGRSESGWAIDALDDPMADEITP